MSDKIINTDSNSGTNSLLVILVVLAIAALVYLVATGKLWNFNNSADDTATPDSVTVDLNLPSADQEAQPTELPTAQ